MSNPIGTCDRCTTMWRRGIRMTMAGWIDYHGKDHYQKARMR